MTSKDGICYSFDHRANGYSRGEGFGVIIIKSLSQALKDGDTIRAVVRATSANQNGRMPGITQPSSVAQESMIRRAYALASLDMSETALVEAHGTGTPLGDPVEATGIGNAFNTPRKHSGPLYIGALKSNIGHLEGASGIAGVIKTILVLENGVIPPNIWFEKPNPKIDADKFNFEFPTVPTQWPTSGLRRASVNSFGVGGANVHAILDDAYNYLRLHGLSGKTKVGNTAPLVENGSHSSTSNEPVASCKPYLVIFSMAEQSGLERLTAAYREYLQASKVSEDPDFLANLAYTLSEKRSRFPWRSFVVADSVAALESGLRDGPQTPIQSIRNPNVCFVFNGQGAQWWAMGRELLVYSVFGRSLQESEECFRSMGCKWSLMGMFNQPCLHSFLTDYRGAFERAARLEDKRYDLQSTNVYRNSDCSC
jgi:acyl transferase domain-containing protein